VVSEEVQVPAHRDDHVPLVFALMDQFRLRDPLAPLFCEKHENPRSMQDKDGPDW
jgi:hypothetical protein